MLSAVHVFDRGYRLSILLRVLNTVCNKCLDFSNRDQHGSIHFEGFDRARFEQAVKRALRHTKCYGSFPLADNESKLRGLI